MNECDYCIHVEMCRWRKELEERGCDFFDDGNKWIPISERLPEKNVWVLVTVEQSGVRHQEMMRRHNYMDAWTDNIDNYTDEITAWMPLPEPYNPQERSE